MPEELANAPDMPELVAHVWQFFVRLHKRRGSNGMGENPLLYSEIESWCRLSGISLYQWELDTIEAIDDAYMSEQSEARAKEK